MSISISPINKKKKAPSFRSSSRQQRRSPSPVSSLDSDGESTQAYYQRRFLETIGVTPNEYAGQALTEFVNRPPKRSGTSSHSRSIKPKTVSDASPTSSQLNLRRAS